MSILLSLPGRETEALVRAYVWRDTRDGGRAPDGARLNRFPALPFCSLNILFRGRILLQPRSLGDVPRPGHPGLVPLPPAFVAGPNTRPLFSFDQGPVEALTVVFHTPAFARLCAREPAGLVDRVEPADAVLGPSLAPLLAALAAMPTRAARQDALEAHLLARWSRAATGHEPGLGLAGRLLGRLTVKAVAAALGWHDRTLERRFRRGYGLAPRLVRRMARAEELVRAARAVRHPGSPPALAALAQEHGYTDQSHLSRELRALSGDTPSTLLSGVERDEAYWVYRL